MSSFQNRVIGALRLQAATFEEVEHDASATSQAAIIVVASAISSAIPSFMYLSMIGFGGAAIGVVMGLVMRLIGWVVGSYVLLMVGTKLMPGKNTEADLGQLLRCTGFAMAPLLGGIIMIIPILGWLIYVLLALLALAATVVAVKAALDYDDIVKAVIVTVIAWVVVFIAMAIIAAIFAMVGIGASYGMHRF
jgi:hypothetical protein